MAVTSLSSAAKRPRDVHDVTLATTNTWEAFEFPSWVRVATIRNTHATAIIYVAAIDTADGTAAPGTVKKTPIAAGQSLTLALTSGQARQMTSTRRRIALHSSTASATCAFILESARP